MLTTLLLIIVLPFIIIAIPSWIKFSLFVIVNVLTLIFANLPVLAIIGLYIWRFTLKG